MRQEPYLVPLLLFVLLLLGASLPSLGEVAGPCREHACSNDQLDSSGDDPVYGDEMIGWDAPRSWQAPVCPRSRDTPCVTDETRRCYELSLFPDLTVVSRRCESASWHSGPGTWTYFPAPTMVSPYATGPETFPRIGIDQRYVVRACVGSDCGDWGEKAADGSQLSVEIRGGEYACFGTEGGFRCESACYAGAPKQFPEIPDCDGP